MSTLRKSAIAVGIIAVIAIAFAAGRATMAHHHDSTNALTQRRAQVEHNGTMVMPFDQNATTHVFKNTNDGGIQTVVAKKSSDTDQVDLIRMHLRHESELFQQGNFGDPAAIHGAAMPGLKELQSGASHIDITYSDIANGGRITYTTNEPSLVTALHRWFAAQLSDHGSNATDHMSHNV